MGLASVVGQILGWGLILMACAANGLDKVVLFFDTASIFIVLGGSFAALVIAYPISVLFMTHKVGLVTFTAKEFDPIQTIEQIVTLSEAARREGLLSLENHMEEIDNAFLATGIRMAVDGMSPEVVESIMNTEIDAINARHTYGKDIFDNLGKFAPAFGMMGTLVGLVLMLADINPDTVGAGMAVAILTTFYGALVSNFLCLPVATKLGIINDQEMMAMEITLKGVIAIQSGENPRVIKQKLMMYLPMSKRPVDEEGA
jgi:chemotaxis protein MotA